MNAERVVLTHHPHDSLDGTRNVDLNTCFVIIPFHGDFKLVYQTIREALRGIMDCHRADDRLTGSQILERVLSGINSSELIIADLTGQNPNVFYELGLAHTRTKNVLLLTRKIDDVPSDLRGFLCQKYSVDSVEGLEELTKIVRNEAMRVQAQRLPVILVGPMDRTKQIVAYMEELLRYPERIKGMTIRHQAGLSSLANVDYPGSEDAEERERGEWLKKERCLLIKLLGKGIKLKLVIHPPSGRAISSNAGQRRLDKLLEFLSSQDRCVDQSEIVISEWSGLNLFFFGEDVLFEGHKTGAGRGFGFTMVYNSTNYLRNRVRIFDATFGASRRYTIETYGSPGDSGPESLRQAVILALNELSHEPHET